MWFRLSVVGLLALLAACATEPSPSPAAAKTPPPEAAPAPAPKPAPAPEAGARPANSWTTNAAGLKLIQEAEGLRLTAYQLAGQWLIGYGHAKHVKPGMTITKEQALVYLKEDVGMCEGSITTAVSEPVTRNEFSAMVSLCYNIGPQTFSRSTLVKKLNAGDHAGAAEEFLAWDKGRINGVKEAIPYLTARRQKERALFLDKGAPTS